MSKSDYLAFLELAEPDYVSNSVMNADDVTALREGKLKISSVTKDDETYWSDGDAKLTKREYIKLVDAFDNAYAAGNLVTPEIANAFKSAKDVAVDTDVKETADKKETTRTITLDGKKTIKVVTYNYKNLPKAGKPIVISADMKNPKYYAGLQVWDGEITDYQKQLENFTSENGKVSLKQEPVEKTQYSMQSVLLCYGEN